MGAFYDDPHIEEILYNSDHYISADALIASMIEEVDVFRGTRPYPDDIAMLSLKYKV